MCLKEKPWSIQLGTVLGGGEMGKRGLSQVLLTPSFSGPGKRGTDFPGDKAGKLSSFSSQAWQLGQSLIPV